MHSAEAQTSPRLPERAGDVCLGTSLRRGFRLTVSVRSSSDAEVGFRGRCQSKTGARPAARAPSRLSVRGREGVSPQLNGAPSRVRSSPRRPQMRSRSPTSWLRRRLHAGSAAPGEYWVYCGPCSTPRARYAARTPRDRRGGSVSGDPSAKQQPASESGASLHSRPGGGRGGGVARLLVHDHALAPSSSPLRHTLLPSGASLFPRSCARRG